MTTSATLHAWPHIHVYLVIQAYLMSFGIQYEVSRLPLFEEGTFLPKITTQELGWFVNTWWLKKKQYSISNVHDVLMYPGAKCYCDVNLSIYPHQAGWKISLASLGIEPAISNVASPCEIQKVQKTVRQSLRYLQQNFTTLQNLYDAVSNCADEIS